MKNNGTVTIPIEEYNRLRDYSNIGQDTCMIEEYMKYRGYVITFAKTNEVLSKLTEKDNEVVNELVARRKELEKENQDLKESIFDLRIKCTQLEKAYNKPQTIKFWKWIK